MKVCSKCYGLVTVGDLKEEPKYKCQGYCERWFTTKQYEKLKEYEKPKNHRCPHCGKEL